MSPKKQPLIRMIHFLSGTKNSFKTFLVLGIIILIAYSSIHIQSSYKSETYPSFDEAFKYVLKNEGGHSNSDLDAGGETNYGIASNFNPGVDVKKLSLNEAKNIYKKNYWDVGRYGEIPNRVIAIKTFDNCVMMGEKQAGIILQRAIIACGHQIVVDGEIGEQTFEAIKAIKNHEGLLWALRAETINFFHQLVKSKPNQSIFLMGWIARVFRTP